MKNAAQFLGIIAIATVIGLLIMACEEPAESPTLTSITANYTGGSVAVNTDVNSLKSNLTVKAQYSDNTGKTLDAADYSLSGDLSASGQKTVTVTYEDQTTTFTVTVNSDITYTLARADGEDGVSDTTGIVFTFSASVDSLNLSAADITIGGTASKGAAELTGTGTTRTLAITVNSAGTATAAINKIGIEAETKHVTVYKAGESAPILTGITAVYTGTAAIYPTTPLDSLKANLTVKAQYTGDGENTLSEHEYSLSGTLAVGTSTVTVTFEGKTTTFTVTVAPLNKTLTSITLNTTSVKRDYNQNETLNLTGLVVTANYSDSTGAAVAAYTANPTHGAVLSTAGTITVTISYTEGAVTQSDTFTVTVTDPNQPTEGLAYELITSGTHAYTYRVRKGTVTSGSVVIPATYEGLPVREIGSNAFGGLIGLTAVRIPDSVTVIGDYAFSSCTGLIGITLPEGVTSIGSYAFQNCTGITGITIPENVTTIGSGAFTGCTSLTDITIDNTVFAVSQSMNWLSIFPANGLSVTFKKNPGNYAFYNCYRLTSVTFADSVTSIGSYAFSYCTGLTDITIPDSVTSIGDEAFRGCTGLTSVTIGANVTSIGSYAFGNCTGLTNVTIGTGVTTIGSNAFGNCAGLTNIIIPDSVTSIGSRAFVSCSSLTSITIGANVTSIGDYAFYSCAGLTSVTVNSTSIGNWFLDLRSILTSVTIGNSVTSIGQQAFSYCAGLTDITIPDSVTSVGNSAFSSCTSLTSVTFAPNSQLQTIGDEAFRGCAGLTNIIIPDSVTSMGTSTFFGCRNLASITIPNSVTSIGQQAFSYCSGLTDITIPDSVTSVGNSAFSSCTSLASVTFAPNSQLQTIGDYAFASCSSLTSITIPDSVTSIGNYAFSVISYDAAAPGLTSITIGAGVTSIGSNAFVYCTNLISVTFRGTIPYNNFDASAFGTQNSGGYIGDLRFRFYQNVSTDGTPGTYTRPNTTSTTWTRVS